MQDLPIILVVEDDHLTQSIAKTPEDGGLAIVIASSGKQAMELLDSADVGHPALVTDINLFGATSLMVGKWRATPEKLNRHFLWYI